MLYEYAEYCFVIRRRRRVRAMARLEFWSRAREEWRLWDLGRIQDARKGSRVAGCLENWLEVRSGSMRSTDNSWVFNGREGRCHRVSILECVDSLGW